MIASRPLKSMIILLAIAICSFTYGQAGSIGEYVTASSCPFELPDGLVLGQNFSYGHINVPVFHKQPTGAYIRLDVAIFPCSDPENKKEPMVMNTSGPGKSNMDNFIPQIASGLGSYLLPGRDIVIIELRGLRYSSTFLNCEEVFQANIDMLDENLSYDESMTRLSEALKKARIRFENDNIELSAYNNTETAKDIHMVMDALGYSKFNIVGSSAGTLIAQNVIRENPERVRCAILDAGLPVEKTLLCNYVGFIVERLKIYFSECQQDSVCNQSFPYLEERFLDLVESLNNKPLEISTKDPVSGEERTALINGYRLSEHVFMNMFYTTQIPLLISNILNGDYSSLEQFANGKYISNHFADGLGHTIFLSETGDCEAKDIQIDPAYRLFADGITLSGLGWNFLCEVKKQWGIDSSNLFRATEKETLDTPILVLNGKYDPVIPVQFDKILKKQFINSYIYRFDGVAHSAFDNATSCVLPMFLDFLNNPNQAPQSDCIKLFKQEYQVK